MTLRQVALEASQARSNRPDEPTPQEGSGVALWLADVGVGYGRTPVLRGVSFEVGRGEWLAVIGPNGAGKSTLLKAIVGALPYQGSMGIGQGGRPIAGSSSRGSSSRGSSSPRIGYVPQQPILPPGMTTAEYVLLGRTAHLSWFRSESAADRRRVADVLDRLDLTSLAGRPVTELSGGEGQRATLARALVQEVSVLVLDEPTSALDLAHQISVLELVDELRGVHDLAVVTAMHDLTIASRFADRLLLLAGGAQAALGPAAEVLTRELLSRHYRTPVTVIDGPDGGLVVVPLRTPGPDRPPGQLPTGARHVR